jgi:hypothetical protein
LSAPKRSRAKTAATSKAAPKPCSFTILERVPVRDAAHTVVWAGLRKHGTRQQIIDAEHPGDALPAHVVVIDQLGADAVAAISEVLAERRALALAAEKGPSAGDILGKRLDRLFEQELEWLAVRNLLAAALRAGGTSARRKKTRVLLLVDA